MDIHSIVLAAHSAIDDDALDIAKSLIVCAEASIASAESVEIDIRYALGGALIDLGTRVYDEDMVERGTQLTEEVVRETAAGQVSASMVYNAGNGYSAIWQFRTSTCIEKGLIDESYMKAKQYFQRGLDLIKTESNLIGTALHIQLLVNFANLYDSIGRSMEALRLYDSALRISPDFPEALGNKGITLSYYALLVPGFTHHFLLEAQRLLTRALTQQVETGMECTFRRNLDYVNHIIEGHDDFTVEVVPSLVVKTGIHAHLQDLCIREGLYLCPATHIESLHGYAVGDPMFISKLYSPIIEKNRIDRYITFLNEIKQDYVLARYLFAQSQYRTDSVDAVDEGVTQYSTLDYSLSSTYVQLLKQAFVTAVDLLDKVANFIWDYCDVKALAANKVDFRRIWSTRCSPNALRPELAVLKNYFLLALFDIAKDFSADGLLSDVYEHRHALTHRFLVVHEMIRSDQDNPDIPRVIRDELEQECLTVLRYARSAIIYLILFVDSEERANESDGPNGSVYLANVDGNLRWKPYVGDSD